MRNAASGFVARWPQIAGLWLTFLAYSLVRAPVPAVNEPHYLVKARHYWQPDWCRGDLFLESANPHIVFYQTIGWLTSVVSLETAAVLGRSIALLLLAIGWDRLLAQLSTGKWGSLCAAWLFLLLQAQGNFAGEWLVGGVESKVIAYALVMWGCGSLLDGRLKTGGAFLGGGVSFHPVVGAWCVACLAGSAVLRIVWDRFRTATDQSSSQPRVPLWQYVPALACGVACSLPGLIPAVSMLASSDPATALRADIIQVAIRLDHHLDPYMFRWSAYAYYAVMVIVWLAVRRLLPADAATRWLAAFTWMAIAVALLGWLASAGPRPITHLPLLAWRIKLLKLYPFRVADLVVPFTLAVTVAQISANTLALTSLRSRRTSLACGFAVAFLTSLLLPGVDRNPSRMSPAVKADWIAALKWVAAETPADSVLWTPDEDWAVKWYGERAEFVNFKDCPQDAAGIVEWYERRVQLAEWKRDAAADGHFTGDELHALHEQTGITHIVLSRMGPIDSEPVFANGSFRVYALNVP